MTSSLDRKIEAAARRAQADREAKGLPPERFHKDDHQVDGTVKPSAHAAPAPTAAPAAAPKKKTWFRIGADWFNDQEPTLIYRTRDGLRPEDDGRNVIETLDKVVGTHVPDTVPGSVAQTEVGLRPKPQRMWVRDGLAWVDDNEDQCAFYFTRDSEPPNEDMSNVDSIRTVKTITTAQAMTVVVDAVQTDIDVARSWHDEVVACTLEHVGDTPITRENARAIAKRFMMRTFGISPESELFRHDEEPDIEMKFGFDPISSRADSIDALAYMMDGVKRQQQVYCGIDLATPFEHGQYVMYARMPGKSWLTMEFFREMQRELTARHQLLINELMTARPAPIMVRTKDIEQSTLDLLMTGMSVTQNGKRVDPRTVRLPLDEMPSGNFGQRQPKPTDRWDAMPLDEWLTAVHGPSTPESPQAPDTAAPKD